MATIDGQAAGPSGEQEPVTNTHNERTSSPDHSISSNTAPVQSVKFELKISERTISIIALTAVIMLSMFCYGLWARTTLLQMYYDDLKAAMLLYGINPHPHMPGEKP